MSNQFRRVIRVTVEGDSGRKTFEGLRILFEVEKSIVGYPNLATISIYNLSASSRQSINEEYQRIELIAGYEDNLTTLFKGDLRTVAHRREGPDIITEIYSADGDLDYQNAMVNEVIPAGSTPKDIVSQMANNFSEVSQGYVDELLPQVSTTRDLVASGSVVSQYESLARDHGLNWSIQNKEVQVLNQDSYIDKTTTISSENGMIGIPTITEIGVDIQTLFNPSLIPNTLVRVISNFAEVSLSQVEFTKRDTDLGGGVFRINKGIYTGDNFDGDFTCNLECQRIRDGRTI